MHAVVRTLLIFAIALPFFTVDLGRRTGSAAAVVLLVGSVSVAGLAILAGVLPLLYPERGQQMSLMMQAFVLLVSGVYYEVDVLPAWLQVFSYISPATYILDGIRGAIIDGESVADVLAAAGGAGGVRRRADPGRHGAVRAWRSAGRRRRAS